MLTVDLHLKNENTDTAVYNLYEMIVLCKRQKTQVLACVVGYGSSGKTHKIRTAVLLKLKEYQQNNFIKEYIEGNKVDIFNLEYQKLKYKHCLPKEAMSRRNPVIIYVFV